MNINTLRKVHMIGIKGVGMTMLAQFYCGQGIVVSGSDTAEKYMTDEVLSKCGIKVFEKFNPANIPADADLIVHSTAYTSERNGELAAASRGKARVLSYPEALAEIFNGKYGIAVTGSHGKTTTTAWLGFVLESAGKHPTVMAGAAVPQLGGNCLVSPSDLLVAELDEYQNKLKYFQPKGVLLNNIDYDHPDFFPNADVYRDVFVEFIKKVPTKGFLVANADDQVVRQIVHVNCRGKVITYAIDEAADFVAYDIRQNGDRQQFKVKMAAPDESDDEDGFDAIELGDFNIQLSGRHNILNALAVIAASVELETGLADIRGALAEFTGAARRMQILGTFRGATIIDDYAHHPTEIASTLAGARAAYPGRKLTVVFHPHTYSRTLGLLNDFAKSFGDADKVIVLDIYGSAREKAGGVHSRELVEKIKSEVGSRKSEIIHIPTLAECEAYLRENIEREEVVILMGAGDVFRVGENLIK